MSNFENKIVWITGASSGIGEELAVQLAEKGCTLVLSARREEALKRVKSKLANADSHLVLPLDLAENKDFPSEVEKVTEQFGRIDFLFNCGGISQRSEVASTLLEVDRKIMEVNYFGNIALCKAVLPVMQRQKGGHFVVISSISGKFGFFMRSAYAASKHALHGFYESLLLEEEKNNIKVTIVCPGKINTPISKSALTGDGSVHNQMDHNQETGMPVDTCVRQLLKAVEKNKKEVLIGNKEIFAVKMKQYLPGLFWKIIRKQSAT